MDTSTHMREDLGCQAGDECTASMLTDFPFAPLLCTHWFGLYLSTVSIPLSFSQKVERRVYLRTTRDVSHGDELFVSYGNKYHDIHF
jgi:hypothetical protein